RVAGPAPLRAPLLAARPRAPHTLSRRAPRVAPAAAATRVLGAADPGPHGILRPAPRRREHRVSGRSTRLGGTAVTAVNERTYDVVIVGSGAGAGTVAQALAPLVRDGRRVLVLEQGPRFDDDEFTGRELEMATALYADGGGFLTAQGTMTLAFARAYGGSTLVYTGTSLTAPERVIRHWNVPGLDHADLLRRSERYLGENNVHLLPPEEINDNNRLFVEGGARAGGAIGTTSLLLRSPLPLPRAVGEGFTCHPALILVAEHPRPITNDVGHPKSYFVDRGAEQRFVLETCMYFPFTTAKALSGFGTDHSRVMRAFPRLQMILVLACDTATPGNRIAVDGAGQP